MAATFLSGLNQGLFWAVLAIGVYVSFRLLDFADLTCEGRFTMGGMIAAVLITESGFGPILPCIIALLAGAAAAKFEMTIRELLEHPMDILL